MVGSFVLILRSTTGKTRLRRVAGDVGTVTEEPVGVPDGRSLASAVGFLAAGVFGLGTRDSGLGRGFFLLASRFLLVFGVWDESGLEGGGWRVVSGGGRSAEDIRGAGRW